MPQAQPIGIFDSGIGGLTVANAVARLLPSESILYFGDTARAPYGPRSAEEIIDFSFQITHFLLAQGAKIIVLACNTATAAALGALRAQLPHIPFVGMEPAVKPAVGASKSGKIGVLATEGTFASDRYSDLTKRFAHDIEVFENPCKGLVPLIESGQWTGLAIQQLLESIIQPMLEQGVDTLVLGCTHYPLIASQIQAIAGAEVQLIDPAPAVARRVQHLLLADDLWATEQAVVQHRLVATGASAVMWDVAARVLGEDVRVERYAW